MEPKLTDYIAHTPTSKQSAFLWLNCLDAFYGGAAGGGKSDALLMAALQYVDTPGYDALLIRNTYSNLNKPDALIPRSHEWLSNTDARWNAEIRTWRFPSGATLGFGYLEGPLDHFNYQGSAYQFIGVDELCQIRENQALYLFSRLRRLEKYKHIPIRFRATSNPPASEQASRGKWVKQRYIDSDTRQDRIFIPAKIDDNKYLDKDEYTQSLSQLDPVTRQQLLEGDWDINVKGRMFDRSWFKIVDSPPKNNIKQVRYWDMAATEPSKTNRSPDYTSGCKMTMTNDGLYYIENIIKVQKSPHHNEILVKQTAELDGKTIAVWMEQEPGSSGKAIIDHYRRDILPGFIFYGDKVTGSKRQRAMPFASQAEAGNVFLVKGNWIEDFLEEIELFPDGEHDDQVDSVSGAFDKLTGTRFDPRIRMI